MARGWGGMKLFALLFLSLSLTTCVTSCVTVQDCSVYKVDSPKRCRCIRENGELERARACSKVANKKFREKVKAQCYRQCFDDCSKCEEL